MYLTCRCMDLIQTVFSTGFGFSVNSWKSGLLNIPQVTTLCQIKLVSKSWIPKAAALKHLFVQCRYFKYTHPVHFVLWYKQNVNSCYYSLQHKKLYLDSFLLKVSYTSPVDISDTMFKLLIVTSPYSHVAQLHSTSLPHAKPEQWAGHPKPDHSNQPGHTGDAVERVSGPRDHRPQRAAKPGRIPRQSGEILTSGGDFEAQLISNSGFIYSSPKSWHTYGSHLFVP